MLKAVEKDVMKAGQERTYADPAQWHHSTVVSPSKRLRMVRSYAALLELFGLPPEASPPLQILEPGCGVGALSQPLSVLGEVIGLDYSHEAIATARQLWGDGPRVRFVEADGTMPEEVPELAGLTFDVVLLREFHPLTRHIVGNPKPSDVVRRYRRLLHPGGILVIEHALPREVWARQEDILQTSHIVQEFGGIVFITEALRIALASLAWLPNRWDAVRWGARLCGPLVALACLLTKRHLSKTIIIRTQP